MSGCDLEILLEEPNRVFRPGEPIRGQVRVDVDRDCRCDGLSVRACWRTHGKGDASGGWKGEPIRLFEGQWRAGDERVYGFEFEAPAEPFTYHGHIINLDWYLEASADIPYRPAASQCEFLLGRREGGVSVKGVPRSAEETEWSKDSNVSSIGCMGVFFIMPMWLVFFVLLAIMFPAEYKRPETWFTIGFLLFLAAIPLVLFSRNRLAQRKLGVVRFSVDPCEVVRGDTFAARLEFETRQRVELGGIQVRFIGREVAMSGSGTDRMTHFHTLHEESFDWVEGGTAYHAGQQVDLEKFIEVPEDAAPTFVSFSSSNRVEWAVHLRMELSGWPDYVTICTVDVIG